MHDELHHVPPGVIAVVVVVVVVIKSAQSIICVLIVSVLVFVQFWLLLQSFPAIKNPSEALLGGVYRFWLLRQASSSSQPSQAGSQGSFGSGCQIELGCH
ncbi:MAG TPA: hypothetical protein V6C93_21355 [Allocoleopsis sp.]